MARTIVDMTVLRPNWMPSQIRSLMKHTLANNLRVWNKDYPWTRDGDEWVDQAEACGQLYEAWKASLIQEFIEPNVTRDSSVLEIAPGHGRWSSEIAPRCSHLTLVDLSANCIDFCRDLLHEYDHIEYKVGDGRSLPGVSDGSVDFVWSYDSFVHMRRKIVGAYIAEIARVLKPGGLAILHHAGRRHLFIPLRRFCISIPRGQRYYNLLTLGHFASNDGWRSDVSRWMVRRFASDQGLQVVSQLTRWGDQGQFGIPLYRDTISILRKPT